MAFSRAEENKLQDDVCVHSEEETTLERTLSWPHRYLIYTNSEQYVIYDQHFYTKFAHILRYICFIKKKKKKLQKEACQAWKIIA